MTQLQILVGTTSGNTEYLADHAADLIREKTQIDVLLHYEPDLDIIDKQQPWLIFIASHGAGDYADSMLDFYDQLRLAEDLSDLKFAVVAIGESCYDTYCEAGRDLDQRLEKLNGQRLCQRLEIDMLEQDPEKAFEHYLPQWIDVMRSYTHK